jgi:potassium/chloride transporter 9
MPQTYTQLKEGDGGGTMDPTQLSKKHKLGVVSGVFIPVCLNILSILMFLRFGLILGQIGLLGILGEQTPRFCSYKFST